MAKRELKKTEIETNVAEVETEDVLDEKPAKPAKKEEPVAKKYKVVDCIMLNVRKNPSTDSAILGCLKEGAVITGVPCGDPAWVQVQSESISGYCMKQFLKAI